MIFFAQAFKAGDACARRTGSMKGLVNHGNTCYLNAALQCALHIPGLTNYVLGGWAEKDLFKKRLNACALARAYAELVREYWSCKDAAVHDPRPVWAALCKLHRPLANSQPHDAHEALAMLLKHVHDALGRTARITPSYAYDRVVKEPWDAHLAQDGYSIITELCCGQTECVLASDDGSYTNTSYEHFVGLSLDLEGCGSVAQALTQAFAPAHIDEFVSENGGGKGATMTKRLVYCPLVLILHLKRFAADGAKIDRFVDYPALLDVPDHGAYELFGVCIHQGDHYVSLCEVRGQWRMMDDATVTPINVNTIVHKDAYVLFYRRKL